MKAMAKGLKDALACGGTVRDNTVELQGNHSKNAKRALVKLGFSQELIEEA